MCATQRNDWRTDQLSGMHRDVLDPMLSHFFSSLTSWVSQRARKAGGISVPRPRGYRGFPESATHSTVWVRFLEIAREFPKKIAVEDQGRTWTYQQLQRKAEQIAGALYAAHPGAKGPVALLLKPGAALIAGIFASARLGRPFVALDLRLPPERLRLLLRQSGAESSLYEASRAKLVEKVLPDDMPRLDFRSAMNTGANPPAEPDITPYAPFCITFTSGTTNAPLAVMRSHRAVLTGVRNFTRLASISPSDRLVLCLAPTTGAALLDSMSALLNGATIVPYEVRSRGTHGMSRWMNESGITVFHAVPTLFRSLVEGWRRGEAIPPLRLIALAGEPVLRGDFLAYREFFPKSCLFLNMLGLTEGAGIVSHYVANHETTLEGSIVPLGWAVPGKRILIMDPQGHEVPRGEVGEIVIESKVLADGYVGDAASTAQKFSNHSGGLRRLRTGDLGRMRPEDDCLEFVGRGDSQLKVGGMRVSPAEVESHILQTPGVAHCVVNLLGQSLTAWVVPQAGHAIHREAIRHHLRTQLPTEAVPTRFAILESLPLLPNGKIDRKALDETHPALEAAAQPLLAIAPRNELERQVLEAFAAVLERPLHNVYQNFFEQGGDSLAALRLGAVLSEKFGFELPGHALLHHPTPAELSEAIAVWRTTSGTGTDRLEAPAIVTLQAEGKKPPLYIIPGGQGREAEMLLFAQVLAKFSAPRQAFAFRLSGLIDAFPTMDSLADVAAALRQRFAAFHAGGPWALLGDCSSGLVAVEMARQLHTTCPESAPQHVIICDARTNGFLDTIDWKNPIQPPAYLEKYFALLFAWHPLPLTFPLHLLTSSEFASTADPTLGWSTLAKAGLHTHTFQGTHYGYMRHETQAIANTIENILNG